jgi:hypothetical protein
MACVGISSLPYNLFIFTVILPSMRKFGAVMEQSV